MVDADEQFPYRVYGPQQDTGTNLTLPSVPPYGVGDPTIRSSCGCRRRAARAARCGRFRPTARSSTATARASSGGTNVETGQEQALLDQPAAALRQEPEGHDLSLRAAGADRNRSAQPEHRVSRLAVRPQDDRRRAHWTRFSPDVTANGPEGQVDIGRADHARHDGRGSLRGALLDARVAPRAGRVLDRIERRPGVGDARRRQDVEERHADGPAARRPRAHDRGLAAPEGLGVRLGLPDLPERLQAVSLHDERLRRALDAADRRRQRHSRPISRCTSCARIREQEGLLYAGTLQGAYVSFDQGKHWQSLQQNLPATPVTDFKVHHGDLVARRWGGRSGFWTTWRRCGRLRRA